MDWPTLLMLLGFMGANTVWIVSRIDRIEDKLGNKIDGLSQRVARIEGMLGVKPILELKEKS